MDRGRAAADAELQDAVGEPRVLFWKDFFVAGPAALLLVFSLTAVVAALRESEQRPGAREWNMDHARNRQIFMDGQTRRALDGEGDFFLFTYRQDLGEGRYRALRSVFVPLVFAGRRWGVYEVGYLI